MESVTPLSFKPSGSPSELRSLPILPRPLLAKHIAQGHLLLIHRQLVYRVPKTWIQGQHPGGDLAILHFVGRDATEEIEAYHSEETIRKLMGRWVVGRLAEGNMNPKSETGVEGRDNGQTEMERFRERGGDFEENDGNDQKSSETRANEIPKDILSLPSSWDLNTGTGWSNSHGWLPLVPPVQIHKWPIPSDGSLKPNDLEPPRSSYDPSSPELSLTPLHQRETVLSFRKLRTRVKRLGLFERPGTLCGYGPDLIRYTLLFAGFCVFWGLARQKATTDAELGRSQHLRALWSLEQDGSPASGNGSSFPFPSPLFSAWGGSRIASDSLKDINAVGLSIVAWFYYFVAAVCLGVFWHQVTFLGHDMGHMGIFTDWWQDRKWGSIVAGAIGGLGLGWWVDSHNVHHIVTNDVEHDPDIQHLPVFAISTRFFKNVRSSYHKRVLQFDWAAKRLIKWQHNLYYIILSMARFNLFAQSYIFISKSRPRSKALKQLKWLEVVSIVVYWIWFGAIMVHLLPEVTVGNEGDQGRGMGFRGGTAVKVMFVVVAFACTSPLHVQIVLSHFSQSTTSPGILECFPARQLRTTMDVDCPTYIDFFHGGLHMQVSHHLFPRLPRHNLRMVRLMVIEWSENEKKRAEEWERVEKVRVAEGGKANKDSWERKVGDLVEYKEMMWIEGNKSVLRVLREVARQLEIMNDIAKKQAKGECPLMG